MISFDEISLSENEEKLLKKMLDEIPRDNSSEIRHLMDIGLVEIRVVDQIPSVKYVISALGKEYLRYIDKSKVDLHAQGIKEKVKLAIEIATLAFSAVAAVAAIVSLIK